jgi:hypothetical protein
MAIQDTIYRWCRAIDRLDYDAIRSVFHPDASDNHGSFSGGVKELIEWVRERHRKIPSSTHKVGQILIEFGDADVAVAETYVETLQRYPADAKASLAPLTGGVLGPPDVAIDLMARSRYVDRFERRAGLWRIARRTVVFDWRSIVAVPQPEPVMRDGWIVGRRDNQDCIYHTRAIAGIP